MTYDIPPPRPLSRDDKKYDRLRFLSWGKSIVDYATKLADADRIRAQNPPVDRGDSAALRIVAGIDPKARSKQIAHVKEHGSCSSWLWSTTGTPGRLVKAAVNGLVVLRAVGPLAALPVGPMAPGETETADPHRETFKGEEFSERERVVERRPVVVTAHDPSLWRRAYSYLSDSRRPNNGKSKFWASDKGAKPLPRASSASSWKPTTPWEDLVAQAKGWLLRPQDERQLWAQFCDTGDEDVRQRLINGCATKCLYHARKMPEQERWDAFMRLRDEVGRIIDKREFDPDKATLPTWVGRLLALRVTDIKRGDRARAKLFSQVDRREPAEYDDDGAEAEMAEAEEALEETVDEVDRVELFLAGVEDEVDRQICEKLLGGQTQTAIAVELGVSQQSISKRLKKYFGARL